MPNTKENKKYLWLIGGTSESREIAQFLVSHQVPSLVTVTTENGKKLYPHAPSLKVIVGSIEQIETFLKNSPIIAVVDASHPYATVISQGAIEATQRLGIPYLRFERPELSPTPGEIHLESFNALFTGNYLLAQRVFLTVGYKALPLFQSYQERATLFTRILPNLLSLEVALNSGFTSDRIIALRPPISHALEKALIQQWQISLMVTKASGSAGGEARKRSLSTALNIPLIVIKRPSLSYPKQTEHLEEVLNFCREHFPQNFL